ncbi:MAG: ABC transporter ATP-binding protein [Acidibacillus sp.]|uniref:Lipopolysaccharide export system ATP-binding protein LptB n=1 Tax=Sulfoacidibacillus ferrooxidans TaxID=2005001 RepID=A0A9X1VBJ4_9BACL|nr:ABC transporter ATP-binding protein [Sulfoacidibacillus ferrooxidans]MCI0184710.1 Lipopolysaccharide export system ATP-binding protein LptB [Sulfoacidibacillus ferrooxidans]MCY0892577.1 ABC transporter ATP-binding protein [Acidibacillus sp.]
MSRNPLLEVRNVVKIFGGFRALDGISFSLERGEILGLVGPNGSGKTTCINVISGLYKPDGGQVIFANRHVAGNAPHHMARLGINRTFQIPKPFHDLTVAQNILVVHSTHKQNTIGDPLEFVGLQEFATRKASSLTSGQQKLLDLARALASSPSLLLIDELAAGLSPSELDDVAHKLQLLASKGISLLVVEHLLGFVNQLTQRVIVMNAGKEIFEGNLTSAAKDEQVIEIYLGR